jgi:hypothetical protein
MALVYFYFIFYLQLINAMPVDGQEILRYNATNNFAVTFRRSKQRCRYWHPEYERVSEHIL